MKKTRLRLLSALAAITLLAGTAQCLVPMTGAAADNLVTNSTFDRGTTDWGIYKESGGAASLTTEDGRLALKITSVGKLNYAVQMYYDIVPLYQNGVYHVHYEISSSVPRYVESMIQENGDDYTAYTWKGISIDTEPTVVDYEFTMEDETDIMTKFCFNCGLQKQDGELGAHTIYLDNVTIELVDDSAVDYSAVGPYQAPILANQIGYRPNDKKFAVVRAEGGTTFAVVNADTQKTVLEAPLGDPIENSSAAETDRIADFSAVTEPGTYYLTCEGLDQSYSFEISENPYGALISSALRMFYLQRCGCAVEDETFGHKACHAELATIYGTNEKIDVTGGWHDAGDYGRYTVAAAKAVADLMYAYLANPMLFTDGIGIPESGNGVPDILDETRYELEWMLKMQNAEGGVYHKVTCESFPGYVVPTAETKPLIVTPVSSTATADFCGAMALAAEVYADTDAEFAKKCEDAAKKAWDYLTAHPEFNFKNPSDITTGDYGDKSDKDERYWAACQMYRLTGDGKYLEGISTAVTGLDWALVGDYGNIALKTIPKQEGAEYAAMPAEDNALAALSKQAGSFESVVSKSPYGSPIAKYNWGSNMTIANAGIILALEGKQDAANEVVNYLLGRNPLGTCFVTGFGTVSPENPHHRPSMAAKTAQPGMLVGGVNSSKEDSAAKAYCASSPAAKCYIDNAESYSTNEITIYWNSPLIYLLALSEAAQNVSDQPETPDQPETALKLGDVDEHNGVDIADAVLLARYCVEDRNAVITDQGLANADVDKDGKPTNDDVTLIVKYAAKLIEEF